MAAATRMELPEEVLAVLPEDPFAQLDLARKITSIALSSRVTSLELEITSLQQELDEVNDHVADLSDHLTRSEKEKESLKAENAVLTNTIKKLSRDVSKLEVFRKTLMQSLQEPTGETAMSSPSLRLPSVRTRVSETTAATATTSSEDNNTTTTTTTLDLDAHSNHGMLHGLGTPRLAPQLSPSREWQSTSFPGTRRKSLKESISGVVSPLLPATPRGSMSQTERTRVDGKEFFRQVRTRLSPEQFSAFLSNVKDMNALKQSREETLRKAVEIFGPDNQDLCAIFQGLVTRNPEPR